MGPELDYGRIDGLIRSRRADSWRKAESVHRQIKRSIRG